MEPRRVAPDDGLDDLVLIERVPPRRQQRRPVPAGGPLGDLCCVGVPLPLRGGWAGTRGSAGSRSPTSRPAACRRCARSSSPSAPRRRKYRAIHLWFRLRAAVPLRRRRVQRRRRARGGGRPAPRRGRPRRRRARAPAAELELLPLLVVLLLTIEVLARQYAHFLSNAQIFQFQQSSKRLSCTCP